MNSPNSRILCGAFLAVLFAAVLAQAAAAQEGEGQTEQRQFTFYVNYGRSAAECNSNCMASCLSACYQAAAGMTNVRCICDNCASNCAQVFSGCAGQIICKRPINPEYSPAETGTTMTPDSIPLFPSIEGAVPEGGAGVQVGPSEEEAQQEAQAEQERQTQYRLGMCGSAPGCNECANSVYRCVWNGITCLPCTSPTCISVCPSGRVAAADQGPVPTAPPTYVPPKQEGVTVTRAATPTPVASAAAKPTPEPACDSYKSCGECVSTKQAAQGKCAWSDFMAACVSITQMAQSGAFDVKTGWTVDAASCKRAESPAACSGYKDCFTCTGVGGVKRACQWSVAGDECVKYAGDSDFVTPQDKGGSAIAFPGFCPSHNCSQYADCEACARNSRCAWDAEGGECFEYAGSAGGIVYPRWCPASKAPELPEFCPTGCSCDDSGKVRNCTGRQLGNASMVSARSAVLSAWAGTPMQQVTSVEIAQDGAKTSFVVRGKRTGAILAMLPVDVDVTATVDGSTGEITRVDQPWWAFLAG